MRAEDCMVKCANCGGRTMLGNSVPTETLMPAVESMVSMKLLADIS